MLDNDTEQADVQPARVALATTSAAVESYRREVESYWVDPSHICSLPKIQALKGLLSLAVLRVIMRQNWFLSYVLFLTFIGNGSTHVTC